MNLGTKKYILMGLFAVIVMANITFASAEISIVECSTCHKDVKFDASSVNRNNTCEAKCHGNPIFPNAHSIGNFILTDYGYFKSISSVNVIAPYVHDSVHRNIILSPSCNVCHLTTSECSNCHITDDVFHSEHGSETTNPAFACGSELCHNLTITPGPKTYINLWQVNKLAPACENCHNDNSVPLHNITAIHQSTPAIALECQTCHSNYLPDTHADIANRSYNDDSCAVCHQSTNTTVMSAIANNDTNCATCHTLHGDITEIHTLNTTTSTLNCPECHQPTYLPDLHNNFAVKNGLPTNCSVCHSNANISISISSAECTSCHDSQLDKPHLNANHTSVAECIICHDANLPTVHFDNCSVCHTNPTKVDIDSATNDCASCHIDQNVGYHSSMDVNHNSSTAECIICHKTDLPTVHLDNCSACHANPTVIDINNATADCNSCHVDQSVGFHTNMSAKHTRTSSCTNCHTDSYLPDLHNDFALENEMTNCTICHDNTKVNTDNATSDCVTCHGQQLPTQHANEIAKHTTNTCALCHGTMNGSYLPDTHNATEENGRCDLCHNNVAIDISNSTSNCTSCHGPQVNEPHYNVSVKHTFDSPTECDECHGMYIPTIHADKYNNVNCFMCHRNNLAITELPTDKNCSSCHGEQLPGQHLNEATKHNGSSLSGCLDCHESLAGSNDLKVIHNDNCTVCHDNANVNYLGATDCMYCHADSNVGYHTNMDNNHTTTVCANCHGVSGEVDLPTAHNDNCSLCHNNVAITLPTSADCGYCHTSQTPDTGHHNKLLHAFEVPAQCAGCHDMNLTQTHSTQSLNCNMCHKVHNGESGPYLFADFANAASVEGTNCFVCHDNADITTLPTDKNCSSCHDSQLPTQHANESTKHNSSTLTDDCIVCHKTNYLPDLHEIEGYDCNTCHNNVNESRIDWGSGNINSSCDSCHTGHGDLDVLHNNMTSSKCLDCHGFMSNSTDLRPIHVENCAACHDNTNVTYKGATDCTDCHSNEVDTTKVTYHVNESASHSFTNCNICHNQGSVGIGDVPTVHNATEDNGGCLELCHANPAIDMSIVDLSDPFYCYGCHGGLPASPLPTMHTRQQNGHNFSSSVSTECMACHDKSSDIGILHLPSGVNNDYWLCVKCHDSNLNGVNYNFNNITFVPTDKNCSSCHGTQLPSQHVNEGEKHISTSTCVDCHDSDLRTTHTNECTLCHGSTVQVTLPTNTSCDSCHDSQLPTQHANESVKHTSTTLTGDCMACHTSNYLPTLHEGYGYNCTTCHNADPFRIDWNNATSSCDSCHTLHGDLTVIHTTTESTGCIKCHDASVLTTHDEVCSTCHGNPLIPTLPDTPECTNCHGANALVPAHNFRSGNSYHPTEVVGTNDNINLQAFVNGWLASSITGCDDCHGDRATDGSITLLNPYPEMYPDGRHNGQSSSDLCFNCHNYNTYAGNSNSNSNFVGDGGKNLHPGNYGDHGDFGCYVCHDVHTSTNRRLITDRVDPKTGDKWMTSWVQNSGSYNKNDCVSSHPECGDHNPGSKSVTPAVITGTVTDNGTAVQNAKVSSDAYGGIVAYTDASGHYEIPNLYYGTYSLTATANGMSQTKSISVNKGDSKVLNIDLFGTSTTPIPPTNPPVSGEGYKLSKNPEFSTEDRDYSTSDTIYVKVWSDRVDYTDMDRMYFEIKDVTSSITLKNNNDGTFTGSYDLSRTSKTGERDFRIRLRDNRYEEYRVDTRITISGSFSRHRR